MEVLLGHESADAFVVRSTGTGLAIEWAEFAPECVCGLLTAAEHSYRDAREGDRPASMDRPMSSDSSVERAA